MFSINDVVSVIAAMYVLFNGGYDVDYEKVDSFYASLGYDHALEPLLQRLGIYSTSKLQEVLEIEFD